MKVIEVLKNIWKITELKDRILLTFYMLLVYRFGAQVVLPGIDATKLGQIAENTRLTHFLPFQLVITYNSRQCRRVKLPPTS